LAFGAVPRAQSLCQIDVMLCPHCQRDVPDRVEVCPCGFSIADLDRLAGRPPKKAHVHDGAAVLSPEAEDRLAARIRDFVDRTGGELCVVTVVRTAPLQPAEMAFWLHNRWKVGGPEHRGLLVLLALEERRIECEVGYGLEPIVTDEASGELLDREVVPLLAGGEVEAGVEAAVERLCQLVEAAVEAGR
jgi:uncharacterized protein